jgi:hypothetical protein
MKEGYRLVRIYGGVEPVVFGTAILPGRAALRKAVATHLKAEPYDDEDGLFYLHLKGEKVEMHSFGSRQMEEMRRASETPERSSR